MLGDKSPAAKAEDWLHTKAMQCVPVSGMGETKGAEPQAGAEEGRGPSQSGGGGQYVTHPLTRGECPTLPNPRMGCICRMEGSELWYEKKGSKSTKTFS